MNLVQLLILCAAAAGAGVGITLVDLIHRARWRRMDVILSHCLSAQDYKLVRDQMRKRED